MAPPLCLVRKDMTAQLNRPKALLPPAVLCAIYRWGD